jgi:hypothetical protein
MSIAWQQLRSWEGSQQLAFEELCCQLAATESPAVGAVFTRKGTPDAGVECYWRLPDGQEHAWQAKFFLGSPDEAQWRNLDSSVRTALAKHPKLSRYVVCLPADRADPRLTTAGGEQQQWFMDKWQARVATWQNWARAAGRDVSFEYWGTHELFLHLSREEHRGRQRFWFDQELLSEDWLWRRWREVRADAGERYTPEVHVQLPVGRLFEGLGRTAAFFVRLRRLRARLRRQLEALTPRLPDKGVHLAYGQLRAATQPLLVQLATLPEDATTPLPLAALLAALADLNEQLDAYRVVLGEVQEAQRVAQTASQYASDPTLREYRAAHDVNLAVEKLRDWCQRRATQLANVPALLLVGEAGMGKTHLLCDVAEQRLRRNQPTLLLLGQYFAPGDPWPQLLQRLGFAGDRDTFLGALQAAAQARGCKALLLLDALNESQGRRLWQDHLSGLLAVLREFPWLGIGLSVRRSYEAAVLPPALQRADRPLVRAMHRGFAEHEYAATQRFFAAFGLVLPTFPLLAPEFQNPLFLKLLCQGLRNQRQHTMPAGLHGITTIFSFLIDSINEKLAGENYLDYPAHRRLVPQALQALASAMAARRRQWLPEAEAERLLRGLHEPPRPGYQHSLLRHLLAEGLLAEDRFYEEEGYVEGIRFAYERLADHQIVQALLDQHLNPVQPLASFAPPTPLGYLLDPAHAYEHEGWVEALSVQLPERLGLELAEVAPYAAAYDSVRDGFVQSVVWRRATAFTEATKAYVNEHIAPWLESDEAFLEALLTVSARAEHPYNADFLHNLLLRFSLAERDAWWTIFLHGRYGRQTAVDRLLAWAWSIEAKEHLSEEAMRLAATALTWLLTSANRFLRDRATKGLVALLTPRPLVLAGLLQRFRPVNDPYVLERLYAVAYGCVLRRLEPEPVKIIAEVVYENVFADSWPLPHVLLRDYARGVLEAAHQLQALPAGVEPASFRPPYRSEWPTQWPTEADIAHYGDYQILGSAGRGQIAIHHSVLEDDFGRYVVERNWRRRWQQRRRDAPPTPAELLARFRATLSTKRQAILDDIWLVQGYWARFSGGNTPIATAVQLTELLAMREGDLVRRLPAARKQAYTELITACWPGGQAAPEVPAEPFPVASVKCWLVQRVFDLGWNPQDFGQFDAGLGYKGRTAQKAERIGKKYQWLAWHELLARAADNLLPYKPETEEWHADLRDIDPSCLLLPVPEPAEEAEPEMVPEAWWAGPAYQQWGDGANNEAWLRETADLPDLPSLLAVTNPADGQQWLSLGGERVWPEPVPPELAKYEVVHREIWYGYQGYLVRREESDAGLAWALQQDFMGRWMPKPPTPTSYQALLGEYHYEATGLAAALTEKTDWQRVTSPLRQRLPGTIRLLAAGYRGEAGGVDCSVGQGYEFQVPSRWLMTQLGLRWLGQAGEYVDSQNQLLAWDPSAAQPGPSGLLVLRARLEAFLQAAGYDLLWIMLGEKQLHPGRDWQNLPGNLSITGAYRLRDGQLEGSLRGQFVP